MGAREGSLITHVLGQAPAFSAPTLRKGCAILGAETLHACDKAPLSRALPVVRNQRGQSILEFLLTLPLMLGLVLILVRVNSAIQVSIVNQQYARSHALWLTFNSPVYPQLRLREGSLTANGDNQMVIGVAGNPAPEGGAKFPPEAATSYVARKKGFESVGEGEKEANERAQVRIRDTVTLCTQVNVVLGQSGFVPVMPMDPTFHATAGFNLTEDPHQFEYCRSNLKYIVDAQEDAS
jgi:hypothetical protein